MDLWLPYEMNQRIKSQQISYTSSQNCDIVSGGMSIFRSLHFGSTFFSSYIRYRSFFLKPHPPLKRSPDGDATGIPRSRAPEHGEGYFSSRSHDGDATGIPRLRAPSHEKAFTFAVLRMPGAFSRGEGAELARRMRCHRAKALRCMDL